MVDIKKIKDELTNHITVGTTILYASQWHENPNSFNEKSKKIVKEIAEKISDFKKDYHNWYAKSQRTVSILAPERLSEFNAYYTGNKTIKNAKDFSYLTAGMTHYLQGLVTTTGYGEEKSYYGKFFSGLQQQIHILSAINSNLEDVLFNLQSEIQYGIFKSEIDVAKEFRRCMQLRPAGAVAGVVIEGHLKAVLAKKEITSKKKMPTMSDYNEALKENKIIDIAMWRLIQRCGDIRNYCVHPKEREPTSDEVDDIIRAAEKILSEVA